MSARLPFGSAESASSACQRLSGGRCENALDSLRLVVEERPIAFRRLRNDGPVVSCETWDDTKVEVEDRLKGGLAVTEEDVDSLAGQSGAAQCSGHLVTDRPNVGGGILIDVLETYRVSPRHDEKVARGDRVKIHKDHDGLVLEHDAGLGLLRHDGTEDAPLHS